MEAMTGKNLKIGDVLIEQGYLTEEELKKALEFIDSAPNREAIALRYGYAMKLLSSCGGARPEGSDEAARLNREALFSNHEMTARQRRTMDDFSQAALQCCRDTWTWRQKLRYRFWECLY